MTQQRVELLGFIARERIAHLQGLVQAGRPALEQLVEILPGVLLAGEEQRDPALARLGDDAGGEDAGALLPAARRRDFLAHTLDAHVGVIIVQQPALGGDADQGLVDDPGCFRGGRDQFPLR